MKRILYLGLVALLASCSSAKYAANFQPSHSGYGYGELVKHDPKVMPPVTAPSTAPAPEVLVASTSKDAAVITTPAPAAPVVTMAQIQEVRNHYQALSKAEKKQFRKDVKAEVKRMVSHKKAGMDSETSVKKTQAALDHDLKLAIIFGAIGLVALLIPGYGFTVVGGIALIVAVVFFVMWIVRQ